MRKFVAPVALAFAVALVTAGGAATGAPPLPPGKGGAVLPPAGLPKAGGFAPAGGWNAGTPTNNGNIPLSANRRGLPLVQVVQETVTHNFKTSTTTTTSALLGVFYTYEEARASRTYKESAAKDWSSGPTGAGMTTVTTKIKMP